VRAVQPNENCLVYFYLGTAGWPVGLKFLEPVEGVAASLLVTKLIAGPDGRPKGVDSRQEHHFWTLDQIEAAVHAFKESAKLPATAGAGC
jgi:hypothetical protein